MTENVKPHQHGDLEDFCQAVLKEEGAKGPFMLVRPGESITLADHFKKLTDEEVTALREEFYRSSKGLLDCFAEGLSYLKSQRLR